MPRLRSCLVLLGGALAALVAVRPASALSVPANYVVENAVPATTFNTPAGLAFLPDGRFIVTEQAGIAWMVVNGVKRTTPVWDGHVEIIDNGDRGLLGVAIDPNYFVNHYVYFLYTADPDTTGSNTAPSVYGRVTRYRMNAVGDTNTVDPTSRTILLGVDWTHGVLDAGTSHSIGTLRFGRDGSLFVSAGDGGEYDYMDSGGHEPAAFGAGRTDPYYDIGAFRAQDITCYNGKILRINPLTGHGYASNPYADSDLNSARSKVWAYGLRNPFRYTFKPGTGSTDTTAAAPGVLYIGDVGWATWEEMDIARTGGMNFGWPCMEGMYPQSQYQAATPAHNNCGSVGTATNPAPWTLPTATWNHSDPNTGYPPGVAGVTSIGGAFYTDTVYSADVRGRYFYGDYGGGWIRVATVSGNDKLLSTASFGTSMDAPVAIERNPVDGNIYYVSITTGQVRRIRYTGTPGGNSPPVASASATPNIGSLPLVVTFSGSDSFDPEGNTLTYAWTFGDGGTGTGVSPTHTYTVAGSYTATLTVNDGRGGTSQSQVVVIAGANTSFPTTGILDNFNRANGLLGASWTTTTTGLQVVSNAAKVSGDVSAVWNTVYAADQEVFATLTTPLATAAEFDLMLKVQGTAWTAGHIEVWYDAPNHTVHVSTYDPGAQWIGWGNITGVTLAAGDKFGARAFGNGMVEVYRNGVKLGTVSVSGWTYAAVGGRIGVTFQAANTEVIDDFGGGSWIATPPTPTVTVNSPVGGESWAGGSSHAITWTAVDVNGVTGVDVYWRDAASTPWTPLGLGLANTGSFTWFVPNMPTTTARVKVIARNAGGGAATDSSHANVTLTRQAGGHVATTLRDFFMPGTQPLEAGNFNDKSTCLTCHGGYDSAVEPGHNWQGSMMSQSAHDPLFYACLAIAEQDAPSSGDLCIRCHAPFDWLQGHSQPTDGSQITALGRNGVACDLCHRMVDPVYKPGVSPAADSTILATMLPSHRPTTYSNGQYVVDPAGQHRGPYGDPVTEHIWLQSPFHEASELCGTCHDVSNPVFTRVAGAKYAPGALDTPADSISAKTLLPLERTYSEFVNSAYPAGVVAPEFAGTNPGGIVSTCQDCHMRSVSGKGCSASGAPVRGDLPLHDQTGGNAWMGSVVASLYPSEVDTVALTDGRQRAVADLRKAAALTLSVAPAADSFAFNVRITNHTGHKLPTGYPEGRRMWVNLRAYDVDGTLLYESCPYDSTTGVLSTDASARVYEAQLGISPGLASAVSLTGGAGFHFAMNDTLYKDNRIPPQGFTNAAYATFGGTPVDPALPSPRYADGQNYDDAGYGLPATTRRVVASLYYQSSSKEYIEFLQANNATNAAGTTMLSAWQTHGRSAPVLMAQDSLVFTSTGVPIGTHAGVLAVRAAPNPFAGPLQLRLSLPREAHVNLRVLDVSGRMVRSMPRGLMPAGEHLLGWDGRDGSGHDAGAGVFWAVVDVDGSRLVNRVVRLR